MMTMKEKMDKLQQRIAVLVDDLRETQADVERFKKAVARDMKRALEK